jgi:two-component system, LuxR family, sensor kinase FixL
MARKRIEEKLSEQARLLDLTHDTVFMRDMNDVITYWNRGAEELYGWSKKEAIGKVTHQLTRTIFPAPLAEINAELLRTSRWEGELVHTKRDGTQVQVASRWALQRDGQGRPTAILETNNDITESMRALEASREAQMKLAQVNRVTTMGLLTASIAHEVNQPVAAAVTNAHAALHWLDARPPDLKEAQQALDRIIKDGGRASEVIGRIRAHIKNEPPRNDLLDINETIGEVIALTRSELLRNTVSLRTELSKLLPLVPGDRIQLQQVILNLIINAIEAMSGGSEGSQELVIGTGTDASNGVLVAVRDSGPGLDPESMGRLFDPFYTTKPSGMGMGLSICRSIIEVHGGRLWATANLPHGAIFQFSLPTRRETAS